MKRLTIEQRKAIRKRLLRDLKRDKSGREFERRNTNATSSGKT